MHALVHLNLHCLQSIELKGEAEGGPSSQSSTEPWDNPFNRAMNSMKLRDPHLPPTSAGRVVGFGNNMKFLEYYSTDGDKGKRQRRKSSKDSAEVVELRKKLEELQQQKVDTKAVNQLVKERIEELLPPGLMDGIVAWNAAGRTGPIHVPSYAASTSSHMVTPTTNSPVEPPLHTSPKEPPTIELDAPPMQENDPPAAGTGAIVSTLEELNALVKVTN